MADGYSFIFILRTCGLIVAYFLKIHIAKPLKNGTHLSRFQFPYIYPCNISDYILSDLEIVQQADYRDLYSCYIVSMDEYKYDSLNSVTRLKIILAHEDLLDGGS